MERMAYSSCGTALQNKTIKLAPDIHHLTELTHKQKRMRNTHTETHKNSMSAREPQSHLHTLAHMDCSVDTHTQMPALGPASGEMRPGLQGGENQLRSNTLSLSLLLHSCLFSLLLLCKLLTFSLHVSFPASLCVSHCSDLLSTLQSATTRE